MDFEGLRIATAADVAEHLRAFTRTSEGDAHPYAVWRRFAATSALNKELLAEAILTIALDAAEQGMQPSVLPCTLLDEVIGLARQTGIDTYAPLVLQRLEDPTDDWSDSDARQFLRWIDRLDLADLSEQAMAQLCALGRRPGCGDAVVSQLLGTRPWSAAELIRQFDTSAQPCDEDMLAALSLLWAEPALPYRVEVLAALADAPPGYRQAVRSSAEACGPDEVALVDACLNGGDAEAWTRLMAGALIRGFMAACNRKSEVAAKALLLHPRDLAEIDDPRGRQYATALQEEPASLGDDGLTSIVVSIGTPELPEHGGHITALWLPVRLSICGIESDQRMMVYRIGMRFKVGLAVVSPAG